MDGYRAGAVLGFFWVFLLHPSGVLLLGEQLLCAAMVRTLPSPQEGAQLLLLAVCSLTSTIPFQFKDPEPSSCKRGYIP